jgi:homogentisate 1,2-dioxygenase
MFETRYAWQVTPQALQSDTLQSDYDACWDGLGKLS